MNEPALSIMIFLLAGFEFFNAQSLKTVSKAIVVPDDYPTIQEAINKAKFGDSLIVRAGTYFENIIIRKSITLIGEDSSRTVIDGNGGITLYVAYSNVKITGFTVQNGSFGIYIDRTYNVDIVGNTITRNIYGVEIYSSSHITMKSNRIYDNLYNFALDSDVESPKHFMHDIDPSNTVDGKPIYYLIYQFNTEVPQNAGFVALINSSRVVVKDLDLKNNGVGVLLMHTDNSIIQNVSITNMASKGILLSYSSNNTVVGNRLNYSSYGIFISKETNNNKIIKNVVANSTYGVLLHGPQNKQNFVSENLLTKNSNGAHLGGWTSQNNITGNNIINNRIGLSMDFNSGNVISENKIAYNGLGIYLWGTCNNYIYHNNIIHNDEQWLLVDSKDYWDDGYPSGGNYWSDYACFDLYSGPNQDEIGGDGIGDTPCVIDVNNVDRYPLMSFWNPLSVKIFEIACEDIHYPVFIESNSLITHFVFNQSLAKISFKLSAFSDETGYCNITIPKSLMKGPWDYAFEGNVLSVEIFEDENETHSFLSFIYKHEGTFKIIISASWVIPEFPAFTVLTVFLMVSLIMVTLWKTVMK